MIIDPDENTLPPGSDAANFYAHMGRVIAIWSEIDSLMFEYFVLGLVANRHKAAVLFERFGTFGVRIEVTDKILSISTTKTWFSKWSKIKKRLDENINFRNQLAHNPVRRGRIPIGTDVGLLFNYYSETAKRKVYQNKKFSADIKDIRLHIDNVNIIVADLQMLGLPKRSRVRPLVPAQPASRADLDQGSLPPDDPQNFLERLSLRRSFRKKQ